MMDNFIASSLNFIASNLNFIFQLIKNYDARYFVAKFLKFVFTVADITVWIKFFMFRNF